MKRPAQNTPVGKVVGKISGTLYRHKRSGRWYWQVKLPGDSGYTNIPLRPKDAKFATKTKRVAEVLQRRLFRKYFVNAEDRQPEDIDFWIPEFKTWNLMTAGERTVENNVRIVKACLGGCTIDDITIAYIQKYLIDLSQNKEKPAAAATVVKHRDAIGKFCRFLQTKCLLEGNPARLCEVPRIYAPPPRYLDEKQLDKLHRRLRKHAQPFIRACVELALDTGMRLHELLGLKWRDVRDGQIVVGAEAETKNKVGAWRVLPLSEIGAAALALLDRGEETDWVFPRYRTNKFTNAQYVKWLRELTKPLPVFGELKGKRAGNQWHLLRSTWAVECARRKMDIWTLMQLGGWKTLGTVLKYVNIARAAGG